MGVKRVVDVDFWNDEKVMDMFTPEDKLFFLYLLTNPHTTQLGIYAINPKHISFELGYTVDSVNVLLDRFENKYDIIKYSHETKEIAVKNFLRHSIIKGGAPVRDCLVRELRAVKNKDLIGFVFAHIKYSENINETVKGVISDYEESNGEVDYCYDKRKSTKKKNNEYDNVNENENENDVSCNDSSNDTLNVSSPTKRTIDEEFETLWKMYPRKMGKANALKAYTKARKKADIFEAVKTGIENYNKQIATKGTDSEYIKHGSTWFKNECWNDEYDLSAKRKRAGESHFDGEDITDWNLINNEMKPKDDFMSQLKALYNTEV